MMRAVTVLVLFFFCDLNGAGDHVLALNVWQAWRAAREAREERAWCEQYAVRGSAMARAAEVRAQLSGYLARHCEPHGGLLSCCEDTDT